MAALKRPLQEQSGLSMYAEEIPGTEVTLEDFEIWSFQRLKGSQRAPHSSTPIPAPRLFTSQTRFARVPPPRTLLSPCLILYSLPLFPLTPAFSFAGH